VLDEDTVQIIIDRLIFAAVQIMIAVGFIIGIGFSYPDIDSSIAKLAYIVFNISDRSARNSV